MVNDLGLLSQHIGQQHPGVPLFLFGHSMGSYIAQAYLLHHSASLHGAILSGSNFQPPVLYRAACAIVSASRAAGGRGSSCSTPGCARVAAGPSTRRNTARKQRARGALMRTCQT